MPEHYTNAIVYLTVLKGDLSIQLNDQETKEYNAGSIIKIPYNTKMNVKNQEGTIMGKACPHQLQR